MLGAMRIDVHAANESAASFAWLGERLALTADPPGLVRIVWQRVRDQMRGTTQTFASSQDWISDFWLAKGSRLEVIGLVPTWDPPDDLDEWRAPSVGAGLLDKLGDTRSANRSTYLRILDSALIPDDADETAVLQFYELDRATAERGDIAMQRAEHVRAWLGTAFGSLLMSIALSPPGPHDELVREVRRRLLIPRSQGNAPKWGVQFRESELGLLYNLRQSPNGVLKYTAVRIGQGDEWMSRWGWLSSALSAEDTVGALGLAARLMRCRPLLDGLMSAVEDPDTDLQDVALAVLRRWLLSLKAMAWLEASLTETWHFVRPADLSCFAFNAVKPEWPHRVFGLSHRSMDVKTALEQTDAWKSSLFAIDANYVPAWESNTGMVWSLFASAPAVIRIQSPNYDASEWCLRERELTDYLVQGSDFLSQRVVVDLAADRLVELDTLVHGWRASQPEATRPVYQLEFPPQGSVYIPSPAQEWELHMLSAAGALRAFRAAYQSADIANMLCLMVQSGQAPPVPPPMNNPGGWRGFQDIFQTLHSEFPSSTAAAPLLFPVDAPDLDPEQVRRLVESIPDLSSNNPTLADILVALEWQSVLLPMAEDANIGDMVMLDLRRLTRDVWMTHPRLSMQRGIAALRYPVRPIWFIQNADQRAESWELPGDHPIFTQYTDSQFGWMWEATFGPGWTEDYIKRCGLDVSEELRKKCLENGDV